LIKRRRFPRIYFGWWMNLVTAITSGLGLGFSNYGISVMFKHISDDLGLNRAATSLATGIARLQGGIEAPVTGWLSDRFGPKWVIIAGLSIVCIGLVLMNSVNSPLSYFLIWGLSIGIGSNLANTIAIDKALTNWFIRKRGLAFGIRFVIIGICGVIVLPVVTWLLEAHGWRTTCLIWAGVTFTGLPLSWYFVKQKRPEYYGLLPDGAAVESGSEADIDAMIDRGIEYAADYQEIEFTIRQAIRTPAFWLVTISWMCVMLISQGFNVHCINFLTDRHIDETAAGGMMAMMVFFTIPSRFLGGFLADSVKKEHLPFLIAGAFLVQGIGFAIFLLYQSIATIYIMLILYGFGSGAPVLLRLTMGGRYFGRKAFASIQGISTLFASPVSFIAPIYAGWIYDTRGSYTSAFITYVALALFATFLMCLVRPPKPPAQVTDIHKLL